MITFQTTPTALAEAPRFALLGLSMRDERLRDRAKEALAEFLVERPDHSLPAGNLNQLRPAL